MIQASMVESDKCSNPVELYDPVMHQLVSRRIKLSIDDRKYVPVLNFDKEHSFITLEVRNTSLERKDKFFNKFI